MQRIMTAVLAMVAAGTLGLNQARAESKDFSAALLNPMTAKTDFVATRAHGGHGHHGHHGHHCRPVSGPA
jgi:hypothetical protein